MVTLIVYTEKQPTSRPSILPGARHLVPGILATLLCACSVQSQYERPVLDLPDHWANAAPTKQSTAEVVAQDADPQWWRMLGDPAIDGLVATAMADNPSLGEALARVDQAQAQLAGSRAAQFPNVDLNASASRTRIGNFSLDGDAPSVTPIKENTASIGPALSWEIDLWGRLRHQKTAAHDRLEARLADVASARLSLSAQIAMAVVDLRSCRLTLKVRNAEISSRVTELGIMRQRLAFGDIAPADVAGEQANLANARTDQIHIEARCGKLRDALVALSGQNADAVDAMLAHLPDTASDEQSLAAALPIPPNTSPALPAAVLLDHPELVASERELAARWEEIGVARAERLPRLDLAAALTGQWLGALGAHANYTTWSAGPSVSIPIFDGGSGRAKVRLAEGHYRESLSVLNGALRRAAQDVEDALTDMESARARIATTQEAVAAARLALRADTARWHAGAISAFDLESSRRALNTAQEGAVTAASDRARAWIALVRSAGGTNGISSEASLPVNPDIPAAATEDGPTKALK